jgi:hypothetical protein
VAVGNRSEQYEAAARAWARAKLVSKIGIASGMFLCSVHFTTDVLTPLFLGAGIGCFVGALLTLTVARYLYRSSSEGR